MEAKQKQDEARPQTVWSDSIYSARTTLHICVRNALSTAVPIHELIDGIVAYLPQFGFLWSTVWNGSPSSDEGSGSNKHTGIHMWLWDPFDPYREWIYAGDATMWETVAASKTETRWIRARPDSPGYWYLSQTEQDRKDQLTTCYRQLGRAKSKRFPRLTDQLWAWQTATHVGSIIHVQHGISWSQSVVMEGNMNGKQMRVSVAPIGQPVVSALVRRQFIHRIVPLYNNESWCITDSRQMRIQIVTSLTSSEPECNWARFTSNCTHPWCDAIALPDHTGRRGLVALLSRTYNERDGKRLHLRIFHLYNPIGGERTTLPAVPGGPRSVEPPARQRMTFCAACHWTVPQIFAIDETWTILSSVRDERHEPLVTSYYLLVHDRGRYPYLYLLRTACVHGEEARWTSQMICILAYSNDANSLSAFSEQRHVPVVKTPIQSSNFTHECSWHLFDSCRLIAYGHSRDPGPSSLAPEQQHKDKSLSVYISNPLPISHSLEPAVIWYRLKGGLDHCFTPEPRTFSICLF